MALQKCEQRRITTLGGNHDAGKMPSNWSWGQSGWEKRREKNNQSYLLLSYL